MAAAGRRRAAAALFLALLAVGVAADDFAAERRRMVEEQIRRRGLRDPKVLAAMEQVPRHRFVPGGARAEAYADHPLPIGYKQTISQPYIVALMTSLLGIKRGDRVLEIGTGSGYQAAVLSRIAGDVYTIEIVSPLAERARRTLAELGYGNVHVRTGDGYKGWPDRAPFDAILVTAAPPVVPEPLLVQLKVGGRLVLPVGDYFQNLTVYTKRPDGSFEKEKVLPVRFVPMTGEVQQQQQQRQPPKKRPR
jgi:protein-L-isoaspartate(D-aspartate) O-methyltransferase